MHSTCSAESYVAAMHRSAPHLHCHAPPCSLHLQMWTLELPWHPALALRSLSRSPSDHTRAKPPWTPAPSLQHCRAPSPLCFTTPRRPWHLLPQLTPRLWPSQIDTDGRCCSTPPEQLPAFRLLTWPAGHRPPPSMSRPPTSARQPTGAPPPLHRRRTSSSGRHREPPTTSLFKIPSGPPTKIRRKSGF